MSILSQDVLVDVVVEFDLVDTLEPRFAAQRRPTQRLREAFGKA